MRWVTGRAGRQDLSIPTCQEWLKLQVKPQVEVLE